jgi:hypothetical protein
MTATHAITDVERLDRQTPSPVEVRQALRMVLESQPFRTSKQCQDLLRYVVEKSLSGDDPSLRERIIGIEVFGRQPSYDTSEDPVVRVRAAEVRKRLAQFYQAHDHDSPLVAIELLPGSYRATFRDYRTTEAPITPTPQAAQSEQAKEVVSTSSSPIRGKFARYSARVTRKNGLIAFILLSLLVAGGVRTFHLFLATPQQRFWAAFAASRQPIVVYLGTNAAYVFSSNYLEQYRTQHRLPNNGPELFVDLPPESSVRSSDLVPVKDTFVTVGDLAASVQLTTQLRDWKIPFVLRSGRDLTMGELRNQPSIMIGAFNNPWTLELTSDLPYSFRQGTMIQERDHPEHVWVRPTVNNTSTTDDYALISRLLVSKTGGPLLTAAGVGEYGTQAAAEFITSSEKMSSLVKSAPPDWEGKNMQVVLHIKVVGYSPVAVEVVATRYW